MFNSFVGIAWRDCGRDASGCDCYGLVRMVLAKRGIVLPSFAEDYAGTGDRGTIADLVEAGRGPWQPVAAGAEQPLDVVLIRQRPWHVGVVVGAGRMLHIPEGRTSLIEAYDRPLYAKRIDGFYRHEALA